MRTLSTRLLVVTSLALIVVPADAGDRERLVDTPISITSVTTADIVDRLPSIDRELRLLTVQPQPFDSVHIDAGRSYVSSSRPHIVRQDWSCSPKGGAWNCNGPAVQPGQRAYFSWRSAPDVRIPSDFGIELSFQGHRFLKDKIQATYQHGYEVKSDLKDALNLPGGVAPGTRFMASPASDAYLDGTWTFHSGDTTVPAIDPSTLDWEPHFRGGFPSERLFYQLPKDAATGLKYSFTYDNPWGDRIVDASPPAWFYGAPCSPAGLHACQKRVAAGSSVCVCGCFPNMLDVDLTLDGKPIPFPTAMSSSLIRLPLDGVEPGLHTIAWASHGQAMRFEVVSIAGSIAQDKLKLGESTQLNFRLDGSRSPLPLEIALDSKVIEIQGGNKQIAYFNGGDPNTIQRTVGARAVGEFSIGYTLQLPPCPCGGWDGTQLEDPSLVTHPMSASGSANATFPGLDFPLQLNLSSNSIVARTPKPPFDPGQTIKFDFAQLGLRASTPKYGDLLFEQRSDMPSTATLNNLRLGADGGLIGSDAMLDLHTEFSMPYRPNLPFKVGNVYDAPIHDFELGGDAAGLGTVRFNQVPDNRSKIHFGDLKTDAAGTTLYGKADVELYGRFTVNF